jgi:hypothetical protein
VPAKRSLLASFPDAPFPEEPTGGRQFDDFGCELVRFKSHSHGLLQLRNYLHDFVLAPS